MKKKVLALSLTMAVLCMGVFANLPTVQAVISDVKVQLNSQALSLQDANGNEIKPLIVDGTTYLPVRAISENLGLEVAWNGETRTIDLNSQAANTATSPVPQTDKSIYGKGDTWVTDEWKVTVNSVKATDERNEFEKEKPAQVVFVNFTFENINYTDDKLYMVIDNLIDEGGNACNSYSVSSSKEYFQSVPIGAKSTGDAVFALKAPSKKVKIYFSKHDSKMNKQTAVFELPVEVE